MVGKVLFVVDGSLPPHDAAALADGLLPKAADVLIMQVVPQLPAAWTAWPAFPDSGEDMARAAAYVAEVGEALATTGWNVSTAVHFSVLSAAEMDREILTLARAHHPDLICLALAPGRVATGVVRAAAVPVLVAKPPAPDAEMDGRRARRRRHPAPALVHRSLLVNPAAALVLRRAGIL